MNQPRPLPSDKVACSLESAQILVNQGNLQGAADILQQLLALDTRNAAALILAAKVALQAGRFDSALGFAQRAVQVHPLVEYVLTLADVFKRCGNLTEAERHFLLIQKQVPEDYRALIGLAEVYEQAGYRRDAIKYTELALTKVFDTDLLRRFQKLVPYIESSRVLSILERWRPSESAAVEKRAKFDFYLIVAKEASERAKRGLPSYARSPSELFFNYSGSERDSLEAMVDTALRQNSTDPHDLGFIKASCLLSRGQREAASSYYQRKAAEGHKSIFKNIIFDDEFYLSLKSKRDDDLFHRLPPLMTVATPQFSDDGVIFLSCDVKYYLNFARPLLLSLNHVGLMNQVHLHIMDASDGELATARSFCSKLTNLTIGISAEISPARADGHQAARNYYHAIRFARMLEHIAIYKKTLWLMDVDGLFHRDPRPVLDSIGDADISLLGHTGRWEPWSQFNASMVGIRPTPKGTDFLRLVAHYIFDFYTRGELNWGIDQAAMFGVHEFLYYQESGLKVRMLPETVIDGQCLNDSVVWSNGGIGKFLQAGELLNATKGPPDSPRIRYSQLLKKYTEQL